MAAVPYFYDEQIKRFIIQFIRLFSNFQVQYGTGDEAALKVVPAHYGDMSRQGAHVLTNNSDNIMQCVPQISCYVTDLQYDRQRVQEPNFVSKMHIREREWNEDTGAYTNAQGNAFTVERLMPVPYILKMKTDIWTSNTEQKLQLLEQILCLYNPSLEIQSTDNYIDWTSLSLVLLTDVNWSNRSVPIGTDVPLDIATLTFEIPIWISAPVKVKKLGVIQKIIGGIYDAHGYLTVEDSENWELLSDRAYITPLNWGVLLSGNELRLLRYESTVTGQGELVNYPLEVNGTPENWHGFVNIYGKLTDGISQVRLLQSDGETEVVGTVTYHPADDTILLFSVDSDTIPVNTLDPVDAIINPQQVGPGSGLPVASTGQRYLLTQAIGDPINVDGADAWGNDTAPDSGIYPGMADVNDIIEYNGTQWVVDFDASETTSIEYASNLNTAVQYKWTGSDWVRSYEGEYKNGRWSLVL